jgi:hypothetical protein
MSDNPTSDHAATTGTNEVPPPKARLHNFHFRLTEEEYGKLCQLKELTKAASLKHAARDAILTQLEYRTTKFRLNFPRQTAERIIRIAAAQGLTWDAWVISNLTNLVRAEERN